MSLLLEWFAKGGWIMWPLLILSVLLVAVTLERGVFFLRSQFSYRRLLDELPCAYLQARTSSPPTILKRSRSPLARIALVYLTHLHYPESERNKVLKREGDRLLAGWTQNFKVLATIAHVAPLLGLLGTVTGLVAAFYRIESLGGRVVPADLAGGIWEALLTTVVGLSIGIVALLIYLYFQARADRLSREMEEVVSELDEAAYRAHAQGKVTDFQSPQSESSDTAKPWPFLSAGQ